MSKLIKMPSVSNNENGEEESNVEAEVEEIVENLVDSGRHWLQRWTSDVSKSSVAKQLGVGAVGGWATGFVFGKVGRAAATTLGTSLVLFQLANHYGYIKVDWKKVNKTKSDVTKDIQKNVGQYVPKFLDESKALAAQNIYLASGFAGGFLLGIAST